MSVHFLFLLSPWTTVAQARLLKINVLNQVLAKGCASRFLNVEEDHHITAIEMELKVIVLYRFVVDKVDVDLQRSRRRMIVELWTCREAEVLGTVVQDAETKENEEQDKADHKASISSEAGKRATTPPCQRSSVVLSWKAIRRRSRC